MPAPAPVILTTKRSPDELRRRCLARLAERFEPARLRHKPLSLVRADARRQVDQWFETEAFTVPASERARLAEDIVACLPGVGPLEELFRDEAITEILVLGPALVVAHKGSGWLPASAHYRDAGQVRAVAARYAETGVPLQPTSQATGVADVRLPTGFRVVAVLPPEGLDVCPTMHFTRGPAIAAATVPTHGSDVVATPGPRSDFRPTGSGVIHRTARPLPHLAPAGEVSLAASTPPTAGGSMGSASGRHSTASGTSDPFARLKQRMTENIIGRLASAGVYDLNIVPLPELRKFITLAVGEFCIQESITTDPDFEQRLGLEILAGMNR